MFGEFVKKKDIYPDFMRIHAREGAFFAETQNFLFLNQNPFFEQPSAQNL